MHVVDVNVESGIFKDHFPRINGRGLATEKDLPLRVLLHAAAQHQSLRIRVFNIEAPFALLFREAAAQSITEVRRQFKPVTLGPGLDVYQQHCNE